MRRLRITIILLGLGLALSAWGVDGGPWQGRPLGEVLAGLEERGVRVIFTERLVREEMRVESEPTAEDPQGLLDELLAPHGLRAEPTVGDRFRVVPAAPPRRISGRVVSAVDGEPLAEAVLRSEEPALRVETAADGGFEVELGPRLLSSIAAGDPTVWTVSAPGFEDLRLKVEPGRGEGLVVRLEPVSVAGEVVEVRASRPWILGEDLSSLVLEREDLLALPHVGNDVFRSLTLLPGVGSDDASARLSVRGGRQDEVLIRLDGVEIPEPYHLRDFNSFLSILSPQIIDKVELLTGGFPAELGDRMSGVLDLTSVEPDQRRRYVGVTPLDVELGASGAGPRGDWLAAFRAGSLEVPFRIADQEERPIFADLFLKAGRRLGDGSESGGRSVDASLLVAGDRLRFTLVDDDALERFQTRYRNSYLWLAEQNVLTDSLFFETRWAGLRIDRDRRGAEQGNGADFELHDDRRLLSVGLSQDWQVRLHGGHVLKWGFDVRRLEAEYDYSYRRELGDPVVRIRGPRPTTTLDFEDDFRGRQYAGYVSGRFELGPRLQAELGLRFDRNTVLDDNHTEHPRLSVVRQLGSRSKIQLALGQYSQSQRLYELQVEDGLTDFAETEEADYGSLGFETTFEGSGIGAQRRPLTLRAELYRREVGNPRPRFENLFDPISKVPELEADRYPFVPERSTSEGLELFLGGAVGRRLDWFAGYTYAEARDRIDGVEVPSLQDQTHTLRLDVAWHTPWSWDVHVAWRSHTGRPTTEVRASVQELDGESVIVPELGPLNGERLPDYHRLDLRLSRKWEAGEASRFELYLQVQNLLSRANLRGYDIDFELRADGTVEVISEPETWGRAIPSVGLRWRLP